MSETRPVRKYKKYYQRKYYCLTRRNYCSLARIVADIFDGYDIEVTYVGGIRGNKDVTLRTLQAGLRTLHEKAILQMNKEEVMEQLLAFKPKIIK